jgi:hypothetical protein
MARNNRILHPKARAALDRQKYETAGEVGAGLNEGYNATSNQGTRDRSAALWLKR